MSVGTGPPAAALLSYREVAWPSLASSAGAGAAGADKGGRGTDEVTCEGMTVYPDDDDDAAASEPKGNGSVLILVGGGDEAANKCPSLLTLEELLV
jgi:hypothetical protein